MAVEGERGLVRACVLLVLVLGFFLIGTGTAYYLTSTATGTLVIRIHDSPVAWSQLTVTFTEVAVLPANAPKGSGWVVLSLRGAQMDLLSLANVSGLLALDRVAPGTYSQVRIVVSSAQGILSGGAPVTLSVPDGVGLATTSFAVHGAGTTTVTLDLDLAQSVQLAGGLWTFRPVLGPVSVG